MKEIKIRVKDIEDYNALLPNPARLNKNYIRRFFARCNLLKAKLYINLEEDNEALSFI